MVKLRKILIEQSAGLYAKDWVMQRWMKSVAGFLITSLESELTSEETLIEQLN